MAGVGRQGGQSLQVVAEDPGGEILYHSALRESRNMLEVQPMLEALERFFYPPALMVEIAKLTGRIARAVE